ncbi:MAG TPA: flagellar basal body P-ring protein FlgI [Polyangiaceae bacterium]|jgi:flagellar P-ring protein precursor FlgI|nr:flagellar basal body P-ring protein FlgI [Polyangiaceae bacterium]
MQPFSLPRLPAALVALLLAFATVVTSGEARADRVRDLCDVVGARDNQLVGYGVVTGLNGTGDDITAPFAKQSLKALLRRLGVQVDETQIRLKNVAAVLVTTTIPPFVRSGTRLDVVVSSIGNARALSGGVLIQTALRGADRRTYAVAQGPLIIGGFSASGSSGSSVQSNSTNTARIPNGALVEREIQSLTNQNGKLVLSLRAPDFATASRLSEAIVKDLGAGSARALDGGAIEVKPPSTYKDRWVELIAHVGDLEVVPSENARVVINERTGTIVVGGEVRLSPVAIAQGGITITVQESKDVSQPQMFSGIGAKTAVVQHSDVAAEEKNQTGGLAYVAAAASLADVAKALSTFGVSPRDLASIMQALKAAGALRAEVVVQ